MSPWLYERIKEIDQGREPFFSSRATANWFSALRYEIEAEYGDNPKDQFELCRKFFSTTFPKTRENPSIGNIVEPLFFSILYCMSIERLAISQKNIPWLRPTALVDWYYSTYFSIRSIFESHGQKVDARHSASANFLASTIRSKVPYPLNMVAKHERGENYTVELGGVKNPETFNLNQEFDETREAAKGMIAQYLHGTSRWHVERTKKQILSRTHEFVNFRTKHAQEVRDKRLRKEIGFLHCAFRQRTKANYRDAIYLSYGHEYSINLSNFLNDLSVSSRYISLVAMAIG